MSFFLFGKDMVFVFKQSQALSLSLVSNPRIESSSFQKTPLSQFAQLHGGHCCCCGGVVCCVGVNDGDGDGWDEGEDGGDEERGERKENGGGQ